jgi:hypothetical protein
MTRRVGRIAADEAHAWARTLRLHNSPAKFVLCMLTLYVNGEGVCFVSVPQLADDCELSADTIRRRLVWLEQIGAIARRAQWVDENGRRNGEGKGRRTTDEIILLLESDPDDIEARAKGGDDGDADPRNVPLAPRTESTGGDSTDPGSGTRLALAMRHRPESSEPEPEQEDSPQPPFQGGGQIIDEDLEKDIADAQHTYPGPITDLPKFRAVMATKNPEVRQRILQAMRGYAAFIGDCERKGRNRAVKDAHRWVVSGLWEGFVSSGEHSDRAAKRQAIATDSEAGIAWAVLHRIAGIRPFEASGNYLLPQPLDEQTLALKQAPPDYQQWAFIAAEQTNQIGAWRSLVEHWLQNRPRPEFVRDHWPMYRGTEGAKGLVAPWPWPPSKDGKIYHGTGPPTESQLTEEDTRELQNFK